jgi:2'-5' RNA ligase
MAQIGIMDATGYSLWLQPEGEQYEKLRNLIENISKSESSPAFEPHVTLLGELSGDLDDILEKTKKLATEHSPFKIKLTILDSMTPREALIFTSDKSRYFRCLFIRVERSEELVKINSDTAHAFGIEQRGPFVPHLSVMYGSLDQISKRRIISAVGSEYNIPLEIGRITICKTQGKPEDWKIVEHMPLGLGPSNS